MENTSKNLTIDNFTFTYPERERPALHGINLTIKQGEFIVLCGPSGCGKTTLLRHCKPALAPHGVKSGRVLFDDLLVEEMDTRDMAAKIAFVQQSPENQIVTDKVWHELAFGLESLGYDTQTIRLRVAEMASFFGIQEWFYKPVSELSGGQKQILALASVMTMQPSVLILDEPTGQLDPIAAAEFLGMVGKINRELGVTVILTEHRLEEAFPLCTRTVVMDESRIIYSGTPVNAGGFLQSSGHGMFLAMPTPMRVWAGVTSDLPCPVTVRDGREWLQKIINNKLEITNKDFENGRLSDIDPAVELDDVWFKYDKDLPDVVKGLSFSAYPGEVMAILGGNGTGKTTALSLIARLNKPYRGTVRVKGQDIDKMPVKQLFDRCLGVVPQNPQSLFTCKTVEEDLLEILSESGLPKAVRRERMYKMTRLCRLTEVLHSHPYDLSGGEQQRAALAKVLLLEPQILLLDEPTKGLDAEFKRVFAGILHRLAASGVAVIIVSHDIEFCAEYADRCALFFDGGIVTEGIPRTFFSGNSFYTSAANRMSRHLLPEAVVAADVISALGGTLPEPLCEDNENTTDESDSDGIYTPPDKAVPPKSSKRKKLTLPRKLCAIASLLCAVATAVLTAFNYDGFTAFISGGFAALEAAADPIAVWTYVGIMFAWAACAVMFILALTYKREKQPSTPVLPTPSSRKLPKRTVAAAVMILLAIPAVIYVGIFLLDDRRFYFIALIIIILAMLPFALVFEGRKPQAREIVILSVLIAIAVAGRAAFFMLPQFKPIVAIVIIAGVAFGGESGFLVGAMSGFVSNMFFGQGPWTPWQMFAFGIIGFLAGVLFKKGLLLRSRIALCVFGGLATFVIYGGLVNPSSVLMFQTGELNASMFLLAYLHGMPFDLIHALATVVFLLLISQPMLEKLDRIKVKFGLY